MAPASMRRNAPESLEHIGQGRSRMVDAPAYLCAHCDNALLAQAWRVRAHPVK